MSQPPNIAVELLDTIYRGTLLKVPIFKNLEEDVICRICLLMKPMKVSKGEFVFEEKEPGREMCKSRRSTAIYKVALFEADSDRLA